MTAFRIKTHVIAGASGLVGSALIEKLLQLGDTQILALSRFSRTSSHPKLTWMRLPPKTEELSELIDGSHSLINLAGDSIASGFWTTGKKKKLVDSRVGFSTDLCRALTLCRQKPQKYIQASAMGYYGSSPRAKDEASPQGSGFLASLCGQWESASRVLEAHGIPRIICRFGIVLSPKGGLLQRMAGPMRWGLGAVLGTGEQIMSWIHIDDLVSALIHLLDHPDSSGVYNLCSPQNISHRAFMKALAKSMHRPLLWRIPAPILRLFTAELADELLLASQQIIPQRLQREGFSFRHAELREALSALQKTVV